MSTALFVVRRYNAASVQNFLIPVADENGIVTRQEFELLALSEKVVDSVQNRSNELEPDVALLLGLNEITLD